ncbi:MAG: tRNA (uridine(34)/cytosine(34)/5-carboxymethylaminomethyluridine(34)-2'-O)-methyltransferase TrmL [Zoogloeaceae bacterium]|jgi:tRNA (cytidine/uridine-2'-O-)-methyltransferase|nr:tRNA (uridine(34)/cytosine(34)/5-carboxymethylaminomethyluridine(34)-2'-O)-methyltransferase TrmL [Zoogloeaceae bacterium]
MFAIVLFEPQIPPNTGNIIRLCANTGAQLHLVEPLGFRFEDRALRRAGLDYHEFATVRCHANWNACQEALATPPGRSFFALTTKGTRCYADVRYAPGDVFVFGPETRGLPAPLLEAFPAPHRLRLPMLPHNRSLNLSNAVAVTLFEAWRQQGFQV